MTFARITLACMLTAGIAGAQTAPAQKPAGAPTKPAPTAAPAAKTPAKTAAKSAASAKKPAATAEKAKPAGAPEAATADAKAAAARKRDPFVSIIQNRSTLNPNCSSGKKCLVVDQIVLKGVVKGPEGMLAVVENSQRKAYFLREKDPVFNGEVVRITEDSISFRERVMDRLGREHTRDVVKRLTVGTPEV